MKIRVESEKIVKAVKKVNGIEVVLGHHRMPERRLISSWGKADLVQKEHYSKLREVLVTSLQEYKTSAVDYRMVFLLEFVFEEKASMEEKVSIIKDVQDFFQKV